MKAKVVMRFRDRHTGRVHRIGEEIEVSKERYAEIMDVGAFLRIVSEEAVLAASEDDVNELTHDGAETPEEAPAASGDALDGMTIKQLREYASAQHKVTLPAGMKKADIIDEIRRMEK